MRMRIFSILHDFRLLVEAIGELVSVLGELAGALVEIVAAHKGLGPAIDRLQELELSRARFEADIQGMLLKAEGKFKAATAAEARERQLKRSYEKDLDPFPEGGDRASSEAQEGIRQFDDAISEGERLQALRLDVAPNNKAHALRAKWAGLR